MLKKIFPSYWVAAAFGAFVTSLVGYEIIQLGYPTLGSSIVYICLFIGFISVVGGMFEYYSKKGR